MVKKLKNEKSKKMKVLIYTFMKRNTNLKISGKLNLQTKESITWFLKPTEHWKWSSY